MKRFLQDCGSLRWLWPGGVVGWLAITSAVVATIEAPVARAQVLAGNAQGMEGVEFTFRTDASKIFAAEKAFFRQVCQPTPEQQAKLMEISEKATIDSFVVVMRLEKRTNPAKALLDRLQVAVGPGENAPPTPASANELFRQRVQDKFGALLNPDQLKTYQFEITARNEFQHRAQAECLAALLDKHIELLPAQRKQLVEKLATLPQTEGWSMPFYFQNSTYLPAIPEEYLLGILSDDQMKIIRSQSRTTVLKSQYPDHVLSR